MGGGPLTLDRKFAKEEKGRRGLTLNVKTGVKKDFLVSLFFSLDNRKLDI